MGGVSPNVNGVSEVDQHCKSTSVTIHILTVLVQTSHHMLVVVICFSQLALREASVKQ